MGKATLKTTRGDDVQRHVRNLLSKVCKGESIETSDDASARIADSLGKAFLGGLLGRQRIARSESKVLHFSEIGHPCPRKLWYNVHRPDMGEFISPDTKLKFTYGDIIEEVYLELVRIAGYEVSNEQDTVVLNLPDGWVVRGRVDARINGTLIDVKSASSFSFDNFKKGLHNDKFGYRMQLKGYLSAFFEQGGNQQFGKNDIRRIQGRTELYGEFHVIDKTLGHLTCLGEWYPLISDMEKSALVASVDTPVEPERKFSAIPEGKSGNEKLSTECSYCPFKRECWKDSNGGRGLRTFLYSNGPVFLTKVDKEPKVAELMNDQPKSNGTAE